MIKKFCLALIILAISILGLNFGVLFLHQHKITKSLKSLKANLAKAKIEFDYKEIKFQGLTAWKVQADVISPSLKYGPGQEKHDISFNSISLFSRPLRKNIKITFDGCLHETVTYQDATYDEVEYDIKEPLLDLTFQNSFESFASLIEQDKLMEALDQIKEVRYMDRSIEAYDKKHDNQLIGGCKGTSIYFIDGLPEPDKYVKSFNIVMRIASCQYNSEHHDEHTKHLASLGKMTASLNLEYLHQITGKPEQQSSNQPEALNAKNLAKIEQNINLKKFQLISDLFSFNLEGKASYGNDPKIQPMVEAELNVDNLTPLINFYVKLFNLVLTEVAERNNTSPILLDDQQAKDLLTTLQQLSPNNGDSDRYNFTFSNVNEEKMFKISGQPANQVAAKLQAIFLRNSKVSPQKTPYNSALDPASAK